MKKRAISILMACILSVGLLVLPVAAVGNEPSVDDVPYEPVFVTLTQGIVSGESGDEIWSMPGDSVYYLVSIRNRSDRDVTGRLSLGMPVLSEAKSVWTAGVSKFNDTMLTGDETVLEPGGTAYAGVVLELPEKLGTTGWAVQAQFVYDGKTAVLSENMSCWFGEPELSVKSEMTGGNLRIHVENSSDASGGAAGIRASLKLKFEIPEKLWNDSALKSCAEIRDGRLSISMGSLIPGGKVDKSLGELTKYVDKASLEITYQLRGETVTVK